MDGMNAIVNHILAEASEKCAQHAAAAAEQVQVIQQQADQACSDIAAQAAAKAQAAADAVLNRAASQVELEKRRAMLEARQTLIDEAIALAMLQLAELSQAEKSDLYVQLLQSVKATSGLVTVNAADRSLMAGVIARLGGKLELAPEPGDFIGGLLLTRGRIVDNLTFDLLVRNQRPQLAALAAAILFPEAE